MQNRPTVKVKNLFRCGKASYQSSAGEVELEVFRMKGMENYYIRIDGRNTGMCRGDAESAWILCSEYLSVNIIKGE